MDRIYELQDEPLSSNTTAGSVDIVSSFNEIVVVTPRPIVNLNLQPHEYPKRDEKFNERLETYPPTFSQVCPGILKSCVKKLFYRTVKSV